MGPARGRLRASAVVAAGAGVWTAAVLARLTAVERSWWILRDDAAITLSHAKNLARHGSIGVSPGGDRVEGFSSPLHFGVTYLLQLPGDLDARTLSMVALAIGLVVAGGGFTVASRTLLRRWRPDGGLRLELVAIGAVGVTGLWCALAWTTTGWLGSGMENPSIVAAVALIVAGVLAGHRDGAGRASAVVGTCLLAVGRVEFAAFSVPLVLALVATAEPERTTPSRRSVLVLGALPLLFAAVVHLARRWYFGAWLPNTAVVQARESGFGEVVAIAVVGAIPLVALARARLAVHPALAAPSVRRLVATAGSTSIALLVVALAWLSASGRTAASLASVVLIPGLLPAAIVVTICVAGITVVAERPLGGHHHVLAALTTVPLGQFIVTGPARLDDHRVAGLVVPMLAVWSVVAALELIVSFTEAREPSAEGRVGPIRLLATGTAVLLAGSVVWTARVDPARALDSEIAWADRITDEAARFREDRLGGDALAIVANPDLGKVSFAKEAIMVDLGWLGDPLLAALRDERPELRDEYLRRVAVPDVVETHGGWSCEYRAWLESASFVAEYERVGDADRDWVRPPDVCPADGEFSIWRRVGDGGEYALTRELSTSDDPAAVVTAALAGCRRDGDDPLRCQPVRRAVHRNAELLRRDGSFDAVVASFDGSPSARFDRAVLRRGPGWWRDAFDELVPLLTRGS